MQPNHTEITRLLMFLGRRLEDITTSGSFCEKIDISPPTFRAAFGKVPKWNEHKQAFILDAWLSDVLRICKHTGTDITFNVIYKNIKYVPHANMPEHYEDSFSFNYDNKWGFWEGIFDMLKQMGYIMKEECRLTRKAFGKKYKISAPRVRGMFFKPAYSNKEEMNVIDCPMSKFMQLCQFVDGKDDKSGMDCFITLRFKNIEYCVGCNMPEYNTELFKFNRKNNFGLW